MDSSPALCMASHIYMIKNIIFDLGNVLLDQKTITADVYFATVLKIPKIDSELFYKKYKSDAITGNISFNSLTKLYKDNFKSALSIKQIIEEYKQLYINDVREINDNLLDLVSQLGKRYSIYIMTNTLEPHFEHWKTLGFDTYFKRIFRSDTDHFIKPEKQAYEFVAQEIGANPGECVFIDDLKENVQGAVQTGMKGVIFTDFMTLVTDLARMGVMAGP